MQFHAPEDAVGTIKILADQPVKALLNPWGESRTLVTTLIAETAPIQAMKDATLALESLRQQVEARQ